MPPEDTPPHEILNLLTYHHDDFDASVLSISTLRSRPASLVHSTPPTNFSNLGDLDTLPVELLNAILRTSDLFTVSTFGLLNRRARMVVRSSVPYKYLLYHAPNVVASLIMTGVGSHFTVDEVFNAFCTPTCHVCGNFGAFLWIPGCIRCCFPCLREAPELMPMGERDAKAAFGISKKALEKVPIMVTFPGTYTLSETPYRRQRHLLSRERARQVAIMTHGGETAFAKYVHSGVSQAKAAYDRRVAMRNATREALDSRGKINITVDDITRFMATISFPYFDAASRTTHVGLACQGCKFAYESMSEQTLSSHQHYALQGRRDRTYTETGFFEHLEGCLDAQRLWSAHRVRPLANRRFR